MSAPTIFPQAHGRLPRGALPSDALRWLAIAGLTFLVYWPALRGGFIWNDLDYVTKPALRTAGGWWRIWAEPGATEQYYPVLHSAFWLEHRLWGDAPLGYHALNVLLHALAAGLLALNLRQLGVRGAWLVAALFAVHPVGVESVAWIAEQKNTLSLVCYLAAAWFYWRFDARRSTAPYAAATACFALAALSKSVTATLPAALLVVIWWRRGRVEWRRDVRPLAPWFVLGAAAGLFTMWVERTFIGAEGAAFGASGVQRTLLAGRAIWFYLGKLVWPADLVFIYPRREADPGDYVWYLYAAGAAAALGALWLLRRRTRAPLTAALFFVGSLFPVLGFFNVYAFVYSFVADHWQYLPSLGVLTVAGAALGGAGWRWRGPALAAVAALALLTWRQSAMYRDVERLYRATIARNPECWMARNNLACLLACTGRAADAIPQFEATLRLNPGDAGVHDNLGVALRAVGREREAGAHFEAALRLRPDFIAPRLHLARLLESTGRPAAAVPHCEVALHLAPESAALHNDAGTACAAAGRMAEAARHFESAVRLQPDLADAQMNLGNALLRLGHLDEAIAHGTQAVRLRPDWAEAHSGLGIALAEAGRVTQAIGHLREAVRLQPDSAQARANLAHAQALAERARASPAPPPPR